MAARHSCHIAGLRSSAMLHAPFRTLRSLRALTLAPVLGLNQFGHLLALLMAALLCVFALLGSPKDWAMLRWMDVAGEGGMVVMAAIWLLQLRSSRPGGRVTSLLCLGLGGVLLGEWVDVLDEVWQLPKDMVWDNWLESSLVPLGMLLLTLGLQRWREEQLALNEQLRKRERLFREHRSVDRITQLGNAGYMEAQIVLEQGQAQRHGRPGGLLMLGVQGFDQVAREHGLAEADRLLQAISHLLLLNLRPQDLLCRYAADRFCVLVAQGDVAQTAGQAEHLRLALSGLAHYSRTGARIQLQGLAAWAPLALHAPADAQLLELAQRLRA